MSLSPTDRVQEFIHTDRLPQKLLRIELRILKHSVRGHDDNGYFRQTRRFQLLVAKFNPSFHWHDDIQENYVGQTFRLIQTIDSYLTIFCELNGKPLPTQEVLQSFSDRRVVLDD